HLDVERDDVRLKLFDLDQRIETIDGHASKLHVRFRGDGFTDDAAHECRVIHHEHTDGHAISLRINLGSACRQAASSFCSAPSTRSGWNGLSTKSLAPLLSASMTIACWPMAVTMATRAAGSSFLISFSAARPSISGMVMSMSTASGLNS